MALVEYPEIAGCESGCIVQAGGWPAPYLADYPGLSPAGPVSVTGALLGLDRVHALALLCTFSAWLAVSAGIVWLVGRRRSAGAA